MAQRQQPEGQEREQARREDVEDILVFYADSLNITTSLYTAMLEVGELRPGKPSLVRAHIKVSPHMLKAISLLTSMHVRNLEEATGGKIRLPNQLVHDWGLEEEVQ
ncbi:MAG: hypothetical protein EXR47_00670 [Dehalococcoidia bacterium]|nr:hypothetical protein [Dehalococcoidia bacterium]